jgi:hypothetical protein
MWRSTGEGGLAATGDRVARRRRAARSIIAPTSGGCYSGVTVVLVLCHSGVRIVLAERGGNSHRRQSREEEEGRT